MGAWALHRVRAETATCQAQSTYRPGFGASATCLDQVWFNYLAFGILIAGLFTVAFALLMMRKHHNIRGLSANRRKSLVGTPGEDPTIRETFSTAYGSRGPTTPPPPHWLSDRGPGPPDDPRTGEPAPERLARTTSATAAETAETTPGLNTVGTM